MLLYVYDKTKKELKNAEEAISYDSECIQFEGAAYLMGDDDEISSKPDLSETLRADYMALHPSEKELLCRVLYGCSTDQPALAVAQQANRALQLFAQGLALDDSQAMEIADLYPPYASRPQPGWHVGEVFSYGVNEWGETQLYKVLEVIPAGNEHYTPDQLPRYFKAVGFTSGGIHVWTQPLQYSDAYDINDEVEHPQGSGVIWVCAQGNANGAQGARNTYEPGVWGWVKKV